MIGQPEIFGIQIPDERGLAADLIRFATFRDAAFAAGDFLIVTCPVTGRSYFAGVTRPQLNLNRDGLAPVDVTTINQMECLIGGRIDRDVIVKEFHLYEARLLRDVTDGHVSSVRRRPQIGSVVRMSADGETLRFLGLPSGSEALPVGSLIDSRVPICVDERIIRHHVFVAGATGSGKSNSIANFIKVAIALGYCVVIYDHKPDYQHITRANDEGIGPAFEGIPEAVCQFLSLGEDSRRRVDEQTISVPASRLDPMVLAHTICHRPDEANSAEMLGYLLTKFSEERNGSSWSLADFRRSLPRSATEAEAKYDFEIHKGTYSALQRKLCYRDRVPIWVDAEPAGPEVDFFGHRRDPHFDFRSLARPGGVVIIRIPHSEGSGRSYALFLSYFLGETYRVRESDPSSPPIFQVIDEAQDIFNASATFKGVVGGMLNGRIRKGRTLRIGFLIGVQSADAVPEDTRQNLNSVIVHRHNNFTQAREALCKATPDQIALTATFGPGEALVDLFGSTGVIHARMNRSPFMLTKE